MGAFIRGGLKPDRKRVVIPQSQIVIFTQIRKERKQKKTVGSMKDLRTHHLMYNPHLYPLQHQGLTADTG